MVNIVFRVLLWICVICLYSSYLMFTCVILVAVYYCISIHLIYVTQNLIRSNYVKNLRKHVKLYDWFSVNKICINEFSVKKIEIYF